MDEPNVSLRVGSRVCLKPGPQVLRKSWPMTTSNLICQTRRGNGTRAPTHLQHGEQAERRLVASPHVGFPRWLNTG